MLEAIECAKGLPLHIAHVNSYCRGMVKDVLTETGMALKALTENPNIFSESYLSVNNGTNGDIDEKNLPKSHVTRNCLRMFGYESTRDGLERAIRDGLCKFYTRVGEEMEYLYPEIGHKFWLDNNYKVV